MHYILPKWTFFYILAYCPLTWLHPVFYTISEGKISAIVHCLHCCSMFIYQNHCSCSEGDVIVLPWGYLIYEPASSDDDDHDGVQTWKANFDPGGAEGGRGHCIMWGRKKGPPLVLFIYLWQCPLYTSFE